LLVHLWNMSLFAIDVKILMLMLAIIMFPPSLGSMMKLQTLMLNLKLAKLSVKKIKLERDAYTIGRHPSIKDGLGFQKGTKNLTSQRASNLIKEKGKTPMASSLHSFHDKKNHAYVYAHVNNASSVAHHDSYYDHVVLPTRHDVVFDSRAMYASSSSTHAHGRNRHRRYVHHAPRNATNGPTMLYHTYDA
jgi:hypothetical protein